MALIGAWYASIPTKYYYSAIVALIIEHDLFFNMYVIT